MKSLLQIISGLFKPNPLSREHQNLISLSTSEKLTELDFVAALKEGGTIMKLLVGLLSVIHVAKSAANTEDSVADSKKDTESSETAKKLAIVQSSVPDLMGAVVSLISSFQSIMQMCEFPIKGIGIQNDDGYVDILSSGGTVLAATEGATVIESSEDLVGKFLRTFLYEDRLPEHLFKADSFDSDPDINKASAVLLRSILVRALASEIALNSKSQFMKAENRIEFNCGKDESDKSIPTPLPYVGLDLLELNPKVLNINDEEVQIKGVGGDKGFLLRTKAVKYPIKCTTTKDNSPIKLKQDIEGKRALALDEVSASIMAEDLVKLQITTASGGSASMSISQKEMLSLEKNKLSLKTGTGSLNIKGDGLSMEHSLKLSLKTGSASMVMNSMGTTIDGAKIVNLKGKLVSFG